MEELRKYEVVDRLFSETPDFWKKIRNVSAIVFVVATAAMTTIASAGIVLPVWATILSTAVISASGTLSGMAQMTKK